MSQDTLAGLLATSVTILPMAGSMYVQNPDSLEKTSVNPNPGYLEIGLRHLAAEPLFIICSVLGAIETVVRALLTLIAHGIHCLIPAGDTKNEFKKNTVEALDESVFVNIAITAFCLTNIVTNLFQELTIEPFEEFSKSLGSYFNVEVNF